MDDWLMCTAVPVLLGDPHRCGLAAREMWRRHRVTGTCLGRRRSLRLLLWAVSEGTDLSGLSDVCKVKALHDFAAVPDRRTSLLALIPCSPDAEVFLSAFADRLDPDYVLLPCPFDHDGHIRDPLFPLIRAGEPAQN